MSVSWQEGADGDERVKIGWTRAVVVVGRSGRRMGLSYAVGQRNDRHRKQARCSTETIRDTAPRGIPLLRAAIRRACVGAVKL